MMKKNFNISIIGGGKMGLHLAYILIKKGYKIERLKATKGPGESAKPFKLKTSIKEKF